MENDTKVEQFVLLAKNLRGLALVDLIHKATSDAGLFTFGELLDLPAVKDLENGEHAQIHSLLRLFAYGTWSDYKANSSSLPQLSEAQQHKLRLLTVVTLANNRRTLSYTELMQALDIDHLRRLEDILISDCIYNGLIKGQLNQKDQCLHIEDAFARDVGIDHLESITASLGAWLATTKDVLSSIDLQINDIGQASVAGQERKAAFETALENEKKSIRAAMELQTQQEVSAMALDEGDVVFAGAAAGGAGGEGDLGHTNRYLTPSRVSKRRR